MPPTNIMVVSNFENEKFLGLVSGSLHKKWQVHVAENLSKYFRGYKMEGITGLYNYDKTSNACINVYK